MKADKLQPLSIVEKPLASVSTKFIIELPVSQGYNKIFVVVEWFSKYATFVPIKTFPSGGHCANVFLTCCQALWFAVEYCVGKIHSFHRSVLAAVVFLGGNEVID